MPAPVIYPFSTVLAGGQSPRPAITFISRRALARLVEDDEQVRLMQEGADLFNAGRFFECHEIWEDVWNVQPPSERLFLQGLIQVAVGFEHFKRGNLRGAVSLLERGIKKTRKYGARHRGVRLAQLDRDASGALSTIRMVQTRQADPVEVRFPVFEFDASDFPVKVRA